MTRRDTPQSERRQALDAAIAALDEKKWKLLNKRTSIRTSLDVEYLKEFDDETDEVRDEFNRHIRILSDMREEGPLL